MVVPQLSLLAMVLLEHNTTTMQCHNSEFTGTVCEGTTLFLPFLRLVVLIASPQDNSMIAMPSEALTVATFNLQGQTVVRPLRSTAATKPQTIAMLVDALPSPRSARDG